MISTRPGYFATKLIAIADAFRSQSAWSCMNAGKSDITACTHSGRVAAVRSSESFIDFAAHDTVGRTKTRVENYFQRFGFCGPQITVPAPADLRIAVVVPCFDEPNIVGALECLSACQRP